MLANATMRHISRRMYEKIMLHSEYQYNLAQRVKMNPSQLNRAIHGKKVDVSDPRWAQLAAIIGVDQADIFSDAPSDAPSEQTNETV